jgi:hypothetical protein
MPAPTISRTSVLAKKAWTPANIRTSIWLDAADISTITRNNNLVSQWDDKSGNNNNATESVSTKQPSLRTINGRNALDFDGTDDRMLFNDLSLYQKSMFLVLQSDSVTTTQQLIGGSTLNNQFRRNTNASIAYASANPSWGTSVFTTPINLGNINIFGFIGGDNLILSKDGTSSILGAYISGTNGELFGQIAARGGGAAEGGAFYDGAYGEIIIYNGIDTDTIKKIEGYLAHKWGLTASLPAGHFYKTKAP